jgi:hypothetical protein
MDDGNKFNKNTTDYNLDNLHKDKEEWEDEGHSV